MRRFNLPFTETILCEKPFRFDLEATVEGIINHVTNDTLIFDQDNLNVICEKRSISFAFDGTRINFEDLMGKAVAVKLSGVKDLAGNKIVEPISYSATFMKLDLAEASTSFMLILHKDCTVPVSNEVTANIQSEITKKLQLSDLDRIKITEVSCDTKWGTIAAKVNIAANNHSSIHGRQRHLSHDANALHLSNKLIESINLDSSRSRTLEISTPDITIKDLVVFPGPSDSKLVQESAFETRRLKMTKGGETPKMSSTEGDFDQKLHDFAETIDRKLEKLSATQINLDKKLEKIITEITTQDKA